MNENIKVVKYNEIDVFEGLAELLQSINKVLPNILFKPEDLQKYNIDQTLYPNGVCYRFQVFHDTDQNNSIGRLFIENWHSKTPKYGIQSVNIDDGRSTWGHDGQFKTSIHTKNIVRIAKKVFKPYTFDQIANRNRQGIANQIDGIASSMRWKLRQNICDGYHHMIADFENLYHMGYKPTNEKFKNMMQYVIDNKADIDKYHDYNPDYYFVLVKDNMVQYGKTNNRSKNYELQMSSVSSKDELPDDIKGKLFVLDIAEGKNFVEDVGLKENDGAYWIIA